MAQTHTQPWPVAVAEVTWEQSGREPVTLWCKKVEVKGPTGAKALRQALPCLSRKSQLSEGLEAGGKGE